MPTENVILTISHVSGIALPIINSQEAPTRIKSKLSNYLWEHFTLNFFWLNNACSYSFVDVPRLLTSPGIAYFFKHLGSMYGYFPIVDKTKH